MRYQNRHSRQCQIRHNSEGVNPSSACGTYSVLALPSALVLIGGGRAFFQKKCRDHFLASGAGRCHGPALELLGMMIQG